MAKSLLTLILMLGIYDLQSQTVTPQPRTSIGVGFYPTGAENGIGLRSGKNSLICLDARIAKASLYSKPNVSSFLSELSVVFRVVRLDRVKFHIGIGARAEANMDRPSRYGAVVPIGVEAFPFPFQNAGLFFEVAPFYTIDGKNDLYAGLRSVGGFVFYFLKRTKQEKGPANS